MPNALGCPTVPCLRPNVATYAVFRATRFSGEPTETDEMRPCWFSHSEVPFDKMWADDPYWYPLLLSSTSFKGLFAFQNTTQLVWHKLLP